MSVTVSGRCESALIHEQSLSDIEAQQKKGYQKVFGVFGFINPVISVKIAVTL